MSPKPCSSSTIFIIFYVYVVLIIYISGIVGYFNLAQTSKIQL